MNARRVLALTQDPAFENLLARALQQNGSTILFARNVGEALRIVCEPIRDLDLVIVDLDRGCRGMTLLSAISTCRPDLRIIVAASSDTYRAAALAYANGAAACLAKPVDAREIKIVIRKLDKPKPMLVAA